MHPECVADKPRLLMSRLGPTLGMHGGVLAGGTGLALQLGHRISDHLEFVTQQAFRPGDVLEELRALAGAVEPVTMAEGALVADADGALVSLVQTRVRFLQPTTRVNGCDVAGTIDIAGTKLIAVGQGGTRIDFVDLYAVLQSVPFRAVVRNALERYGSDALDPLAVGKGLVWFEQADGQDDSISAGAPLPWSHVRQFFLSSLRQFVYDLDAEIVDGDAGGLLSLGGVDDFHERA
jgi:hypothetical protein